MSFLSPTRSCPNCKHAISARAKQCKYCLKLVAPLKTATDPATGSHDRSETAQGAGQTQIVPPSMPSTIPASAFAERAVKRYRDAYIIASAIDEQGQAIKSLALVVVALAVVATLIAAAAVGGKLAIGALVTGAIVAAGLWSVIHTHGVRVAAEGQHLLAALDVAVNTSPFLSDTERAQAMSL